MMSQRFQSPRARSLASATARAWNAAAWALVSSLIVLSMPVQSAPPTPEAIIKACEETETAAQCERVLEKGQLKQFPGIGTRDGMALRLPTKPGAPAIEFRDTGNPEDDNANFKWHAFWDYWPQSKIAIVSVTTRDNDHFLVVQIERGMQARVPAEPILSPDGQRFIVGDFCEKGCGNQIQLWKIDGTRAIREKTFKPRERWYETDVSWRDPMTLAVEYSLAGPRRRLADPGELNLVKAEPMLLKLSDWAWMADAPRR